MNLLGEQLKKRLVLVTIASLALASCSAPPAPSGSAAANSTPPSSSAAAEATPSESPVRKTNDRGNVPKKLGEVAAIGGDTVEASAVRFKVIEVKPFKCTYGVDVPGNGQMMAVTLAIETGKDLVGQMKRKQISFNASGWQGYTADGTRLNTMSSNLVYNCATDRSVLLPDVGPAEKATGIVLLDAPKWPKSISFSFPQQEGGWEWEVPAK